MKIDPLRSRAALIALFLTAGWLGGYASEAAHPPQQRFAVHPGQAGPAGPVVALGSMGRPPDYRIADRCNSRAAAASGRCWSDLARPGMSILLAQASSGNWPAEFSVLEQIGP